MNIFTPLLHIYEYIQYFLRMRSFIPRQWCVAARSRIMNRRSHCGSSHLHMYVCLVHCWRDSVQYDRRGSISTEATSRKPRVLSLTFLRAFHFIWATKFSLNFDKLFVTYWAQIRFVWIMRCPQFSFAWQLSLHKRAYITIYPVLYLAMYCYFGSIQQNYAGKNLYHYNKNVHTFVNGSAVTNPLYPILYK